MKYRFCRNRLTEGQLPDKMTIEEGTDISTKGLRTGEASGDIITHVNGTAISSFDDVAQILKDKKDN